MSYIKIVVLFFMLCSCTKDIDINYQVKDPRLILDCTFLENAPIKVYLSTNVFILDTASRRINNATILLYENEQLIDTLLQKGNGLYQSNVMPKAGKSYYITASANGYKSVSARDSLPNAGFSVSNIQFNVGVTTLDGIRFDMLSLDINDTDPDINYYELAILKKITSYNDVPSYIDVFFISNPTVSMRNWDFPYSQTILFTDKLFNNGETHFDVFLHSRGGAVTVKLRKVSSQYYDFKKLLYLHRDSQLSKRETIEELFKGEPIEMFSNIENGYGVFAGYLEIVNETED